MSSQNKLFELIKMNYPHQHSIDYYAEKLLLSKGEIIGLLQELVDLHYPLNFSNNTVTLTVPMISQSKIQSLLSEWRLPYSSLFFPRIPSTNSKALTDISEFSDRTVLLTDYQYKGKGRLGREWQSPIGSAVTLSLILKPVISGEQAVLFTQLTAAALVQALKPYVSAEIKWPNDIIVGNKKIAGILTETSFNGSQLEGIVVGVGINTSLSKNDISSSLAEKATSLLIETGMHIDPNQIITEFIRSFEVFYREWELTNDSSDFITLCKKASVLIGKEIIVRTGESARLAHVRDINSSGELIVQYTDDESLTPLRTLDFSIRGLSSYI
ncbi:MAG: biotin--[acetyl-CoA-carboxylase] ligase [Alkalibacterium sp.]|nr:biotin--[acetyl-CoA-carboxylase] ligase [Alkalibacterium sp.]